MTPRDTKDQHGAGRPSALAMITAAAASAAAFFVITKSGIAGTLVGAAVFSAVYHGASHWFADLAERLAAWWLDRRGVKVGDLEQSVREDPATATAAADRTPDPGSVAPLVADGAASHPGAAEASHPGAAAAETEPPAAVRGTRPANLPVRRALAVWGPLVLALAALGASGYSVITGEPIERVIIHERVVEKPVVEERVVVQKETVTVTVTVPAKRDPAGNETLPVAPTTTTSTTLSPAGTSTTTTVPGGGTGGETTSTTESAPPSSSLSSSTTTPPTTAAPAQ